MLSVILTVGEIEEAVMTRDDWRELVFWISAVGAFMTAFLMCFAVTDLVVRLIS